MTVRPVAPAQDAPDTSTDTARAARGPKLSTIYTLVFVAAGFHAGIERLHDNSFLWHLRTGQWILDHGIPHHDPYSFTAHGTVWVAQSWLAELIYGVLDVLHGGVAIRLFGGVIGAVVGFLLYRVALQLAGERMRAALLAALAYVVLLNVWSERPLMLGLLAMLVVVYAVELPDSPIGRHPMVTLPVLMWFWANVHGTFALGFVYLALHLAGRAWEGNPPTRGRERALLRASVVAGLVTLVNPYGLDLVLFPLRLIGRDHVLSSVAEWQSPNFRELGARCFALLIVVTIVILARKHAGRRDLLVSIAFLVLGLWAVRNVGLAAIVVLPVLARLVHTDDARPDERRAFHWVWAAGLILLIAGFANQARTELPFDFSGYPVAAWQAVQRQGLEGQHLVTTDAWAGYLIEQAWPQQTVFYDDRYDMYPLAMNTDYMKLLDAQPGWQNVLDRHRVDVVMWPARQALSQLLALDPHWRKTFGDDKAVVYVRRPATAAH